LELAAARTTVLTLTELADTLESELQILQVVGPDGADELAQAMVGLTHDLLDARERQLFARLSIFNSHFARDAAQAICGPEWTPVVLMDVLSSLISRSLVVRCDDGSPQARFRLLQLIRGYATERLVERGELDAVRRRHAEYFCALLEEAAANLNTPDHPVWLAFMDREVPNFRRAMSWAVTEEPQMLLRMVGALTRWFYLRGCYSDGRYWAAVALDVCGDDEPALRAPVLSSAGLLALLQCDYTVARELLAAAEGAYVAVGDLANAGLVASRLGAVARHQGDYELADALHRKGMAYALSVGDGPGIGTQLNSACLLGWIRGNPDGAKVIGEQALLHAGRFGDAEGVVWAKMNLGAVARCRGDLQTAERLLTEALAHAESLGAREATAWTLNQLGVVARLLDDPERALPLQQASLVELEDLGDRWRSASVHDELAAIMLPLGRPQESALHLAKSDQLRAAIGTPVPAVEVADRIATVLATRDALQLAVLSTPLAV
jgi:tetratricopeptide (TPR) repeat protein